MAVIRKSSREIEIMRAANLIVAKVLDEVEAKIAPGISTAELDRIAEREVGDQGARPAFKNYHGFPASICVSVNEEIVHGIPSEEKILAEGDIVGVDFGAIYKGYVGDSARTVAVGTISAKARDLIEVTRESLRLAIGRCVAGGKLSDISGVVQDYVEGKGYTVIREYGGHGIGRSMHEDPHVPNYRSQGRDLKLRPGLVLAIEPMVSAGSYEVKTRKDGWTTVTADGSLSAHFEHSVAITEDGPYILSEP